MTVGTEDHVHAVFQQQIGDVLLGTADGRVILSAPVQHGDDDVGGFGLGGVQPVHDAGGIDDAVVGVVVRIEKVHTVFRVQRQRHIVQALGKGDEGDLDAVDFPDHIAAGGAGVPEMGADRFDPGGVEDIHGGGQTVDAVHNRVGVGRLEDVKADVRQILGQNIRRVEIGRGPGIAGIGRRAAEVQLQIAHGQIRAGGICLDGREAIGKVIGGILLLSGVNLVLIHHNIAHGGQGGGFIRLHRLGLFRLRRRRRHDLLLRRLLFSRAAADDQHHGQNQNQGCRAEYNSLLDFVLSLHFQTLETALLQHLFIALVLIILLVGHGIPSLVEELLFIIQYFTEFLNYFFVVPPISWDDI